MHIQGMVEDGETTPEPLTLDKLEGDPAMQGAVAFLVSASSPGRASCLRRWPFCAQGWRRFPGAHLPNRHR